MILNKFSVNLHIRVAAIVLTSVAFGIAMQHLDSGYYYTLAGIIFLIVLQSLLLVNKVNKTNSDLEKFFSSVQDHDSSIRFPENTQDGSFSKLHDSLNNLNIIIQSAKIRNERTSQFLKSVVDHIDVGLISLDTSGNIEIYNRIANKYLKLHHPTQFSSLKTGNEELYKILNTIKPGQEVLYKVKEDNLLQSVLIKSTELKIEENIIKLISFQDITTELDKKELDSWQRLIRVLTHEIMNSISPITSLTSVISGYFKEKESEVMIPSEKIDRKVVTRTLAGLKTIEETGKGLLDFVDKYRSLTSLPEPDFCEFSVESLLQECKILMDSNIPDRIKITVSCYSSDIFIVADYGQIEQVLINLIKNAVDALNGKEEGTVLLKAFHSDNCAIIQVEDNGAGIPNEIIEDIFVPFYTTKENGSGIGLSLSKQIMQNHDGTISVNSVPGKGSKFFLKFPDPVNISQNSLLS